MRTLIIICICIMMIFLINYLVCEEPIKILIEQQIEASTDNEILYIEIDKSTDNDIAREIHWLLTILEPHWNNTDIVFITLNGTYKIGKKILEKYYHVDVMDRSGVIMLEAMRVE